MNELPTSPSIVPMPHWHWYRDIFMVLPIQGCQFPHEFRILLRGCVVITAVRPELCSRPFARGWLQRGDRGVDARIWYVRPSRSGYGFGVRNFLDAEIIHCVCVVMRLLRLQKSAWEDARRLQYFTRSHSPLSTMSNQKLDKACYNINHEIGNSFSTPYLKRVW